MNRAFRLGLCSLLTATAACNAGSGSNSGTASSTASGSTDEQNALMQTSRDWAKVTASHDIDKIVSYWTDDAIVMEPGQPAIVGKGAIASMVESSMKIPKFNISWDPERAFVSKGGDVGYLIEHNKVEYNDSTGKLLTQYGKCVTIWKKDASGAWKNAVDICTPNPTEKVFSAP